MGRNRDRGRSPGSATSGRSTGTGAGAWRGCANAGIGEAQKTPARSPRVMPSGYDVSACASAWLWRAGGVGGERER